MNNDYTIIIPTYNNRHRYLDRLLNYFSRFNLNISIVDSSSLIYPNASDYNIKYFHVPELNYTSKINQVLKSIRTPFTLLCADDDFVIPNSINRCVLFLKNNPLYSSVQGNIVGFLNKKKVPSFPWMLQTYQLSFDSNDVSDRLLLFYSKHIYLHYAVHKTATLVDAFEILNGLDDKIAGASAEPFLNIVSIVKGKHKVLPIFYYASELIQVSGRNLYPNLNDVRKDEEYKKVEKNLIKYINKNYNQDYDVSTKLVNDILRLKGKMSSSSSSPSQPLRNNMFKKIIDKLPYVKLIKNKYSELYYKRQFGKRIKTYKKQISLTRNLSGFPFYDETAKREWDIIKKVIKKHGRI